MPQYDNENPPSLRGARSESECNEAIQTNQIDCHESANADSRNDGVVDCHGDKSARNDGVACHTSAQARSISNTQNRDISVFVKPQYDKLDSSLFTKAQNDNVIDCNDLILSNLAMTQNGLQPTSLTMTNDSLKT